MSQREEAFGIPPNIRRDGETSQSSLDFEDSSPWPTLPAEVIDTIVDELIFETHPSTSRNTLLSVSLTSRRLCIRVYRHIFSKLHLTLARVPGEDPHNSDVGGAHALLERLHGTLIQGLKFPNLAMVYHLQSVWITVGITQIEDTPLLDCFPMLSHVIQALHGPAHGIAHFIFKVNREHFSLRGTYALIRPVFLSERLNPKFCKAFRDLCHSNRLKTLYLKHISLFGATLRLTKVENLRLEEVIFEDDPMDTLGHHADAGTDFIIQPTSLTFISIHRREKLRDSYLTLEDKLEVADPVDYFLPSYHLNKSLAHPIVFGRLTSLTLANRDHDCIQLDLMPNLRLLKVIQRLLYDSIPNFRRKSELLYSFFKSKSGGVRSLGSTTSLTFETDLESSVIFPGNAPGYNKALSDPGSFWKPTRECWQDVDKHLTSDGIKLDIINFKFTFIMESQVMFPVGYEESSFVAENRNLIADYFPRLSALSTFSLDVLIKRLKPVTTGASGVEFCSYEADSLVDEKVVV